MGKPYQCKVCRKKFRHLYLLIRHTRRAMINEIIRAFEYRERKMLRWNDVLEHYKVYKKYENRDVIAVLNKYPIY